jgi:hypothetical protein
MDDAEQHTGRKQDQCDGKYTHQNQKNRDDFFKHQGILSHMRFFVGVRIVWHFYLTQSSLYISYFTIDGQTDQCKFQ